MARSGTAAVKTEQESEAAMAIDYLKKILLAPVYDVAVESDLNAVS